MSDQVLTGDALLTIVLTLVAVAVVKVAVALVLCGGEVGRVGLARRLGLRALKDPDFAARAVPLLESLAPPKEPKPVKPSAEPLWLLALLQREGRLLDFLLEDIQAYANEQIGAAVRDIHHKCHKAIKDHLVLEPILNQPEGAQVEVPLGFDPSAIRLIGNVTGQPPFRGTLQHHGWRVQQLKLTCPPHGQDQFVVQPAEVELL